MSGKQRHGNYLFYMGTGHEGITGYLGGAGLLRLAPALETLTVNVPLRNKTDVESYTVKEARMPHTRKTDTAVCCMVSGGFDSLQMWPTLESSPG